MAQHSETVFIATSEPVVAHAVAAAMEQHDGLAPPRVCDDLFDLQFQLERSTVSVALVDIDPQPKAVFHDLEPLISRFSATRFVVLSEHLDADLIREAMQIGARQFVLKGAIPTDLPTVLQRLLITHGNGHTRRVARRGKIITLLSAAGGCGATTLAVNLANELRIRHDQSALLIDLDNAYGGISRYLGIQGRYGLSSVLASKSIDGSLVRSTAVPYDENLHVLLNPVSIDFTHPQPLAMAQIDRVLESCRNEYDWTVVDAPRLDIGLTTQLVERSDLTLIVGQLSVKDLHIAKQLWTILADADVRGDMVHHVVNRYRRRGATISLSEAQSALGEHVTMHLIDNDYRAASDSMNFGQPLAQSSPRSALRRSIVQLVGTLVQTSLQVEKATIAQ